MLTTGHRRLLLVVAAAAAALAQDGSLDKWNELAARQPVGLTLAIESPKTEFYLGEVIPLELKFKSVQPRRFVADTRLQDRIGRMNYVEEFVATPESLAEDPLQGLQGGTGGLGGLSGGPVVLSEQPFVFQRILNEWVRFRQAGVYRVFVISRRVHEIESQAKPDLYFGGKLVELVSNILTLNIRPAPESWVCGQISAARGIVRTPASSDDEKRQATRVLRFLDSPDAAAELLLSLTDGRDVDSFSNYTGILGSP